MDTLWLSSPAPALRLWADGRWKVNPAAARWASDHGIADAGWLALARELVATLRHPEPSSRGRIAFPGSSLEIDWTSVWLDSGWLAWLVLPSADAARLALIEQFGRTGAWERDLRTGEGRWDTHMFRLCGFDPAGGVPNFDQASERVHPDDRDRFRREHRRFGEAPGRYETWFRLVLPDGQVKEFHSLCEVHPGPQGRPVRMTGILLDDTEGTSRLREIEALTAKLHRAVTLASVSVWRIDLATQRIYFNDWGYQVMGIPRPPDGLTLEYMRSTIHPDDRAAVLRAADEAIATHRVVDVEARYRNEDGSYRHLLTRRVAERDEQGRAIALSGVSLDRSAQIAEREQAQAFARRIDMVTNAAGVGIWTVDIEARQGEWNEQMFRIYGLRPQDGVPSEERWLQELVHPDDRTAMQSHGEIADRGTQQGLQSEFRIRRADDGEVRWVSAWSRRERVNGRLMAFGVNIDITELHSTRAQLRRVQERTMLAAESAGIGTWERDLRTHASQWDAQMFRLRGHRPDGPLGANDLRDGSRHPDDVAELQRKMDEAVREGGELEHEFRVVWPDGSVRWLATRGHVQHDAQGRPERFLGVNWDITERKRAEQALRDKAAAEQASRAKSEFLARMSHELRTPLNAVLGFAQLLSADAGDRLSPPQAERVERIRSAGQHLLALIDDVLDLASIESSGMPLAHEAVPLQAALHDVLQWTRLQADEAGVSVQAEPTAAQVLGDPRRVRQVIANLMSNAIKYNRAGGHVWLAVERGAWQGVPAWAITVRDDGRGMSAAQRRHLFEPFNRLGAEREAIQGTGIGLAIVHHLVKLMRGEISVESEPGRGSAFRIVLRAAAGAAAEPVQQAVPSSVQAAPVAATAAAPLRLLYIEDNPVNVLLVQELLANHAHVELAIAVDGVSGVRLAQHARPDVVLVDMQLPDIDGTEVLRRLRADPDLAGLTIVALSANAMPEDVSRAREAGFDDYWTKPIDFKAFLAALDRLAQARRPGADQGARRSRSQLPSASR